MKKGSKRGTALLLALVLVLSGIPMTEQPVWGAAKLQTVSSSVYASNEVTVFNFLVTEMELTPAVACGIMANIYNESRFNPAALGDKRNGVYTSGGICQWHDDAATNLTHWTTQKTWCKNNGYDPNSIYGQLQFLKYSLSANNTKVIYNGKKMYDELLSYGNTAEDAYKAGYYWCYWYERPANKLSASETRGKLARDTFWSRYKSYQTGIVQKTKAAYPGTLSAGASWTVSGTLTSKAAISTVTVGCYDSSGKAGIEASASPSAKIYNLKGLDSKLKFASLKAGTWHYKVTASTSLGNIVVLDHLFTVKGNTTATKLATPKVSVANAAGGIKISWPKVSGAVKYRVYRRTSTSQSWTKLTDLTGITYTDKSVKSGTKYYYTVCCMNSGGTAAVSDKSSGAGITYLSYPAVQSTTNSAKGIKVTWKKVTGASGYYIYRKPSGGSWSKAGKVTGNGTFEYIDTGVKSKNGITYVYTVRAYYGSTLSTYVAGKSLYRMETPVISGASNSSSKKITVKWGKNTAVTGYKVRYVSGSTDKTVTVTGASKVSAVISGLKKGSTYSVTVRAYKKAGSTIYYSGWTGAKKIKVSK